MQCSPSALTNLLSVAPFHSRGLRADRKQSTVKGKTPTPSRGSQGIQRRFLLPYAAADDLPSVRWTVVVGHTMLSKHLNHLQPTTCDLEDLDTVTLTSYHSLRKGSTILLFLNARNSIFSDLLENYDSGPFFTKK